MGRFIGGRSYAEKSNLPQLHNPFSFINHHILASDVGSRLVNSIFYSFYNFVLFASMKRRFQVFSLRTGFVLRISFHTNTTVKCTRARFILCQGLLKQSFLTLQLVIRQQDQEFDQQCILPVNKAEMAVSDKFSSHITYYKCHNSHHYPNSAYSFSHPSTLKYLRSTQTDKERPQSMIKDITSKSNNTQDLGNKIRYLKSQASYESVLSRKLKQGSYYSRINDFRT